MYRYERPTISVLPEPVESFSLRASKHCRQMLGSLSVHFPEVNQAINQAREAVSGYIDRVAEAKRNYAAIDRYAFVAPDFSTADAQRLAGSYVQDALPQTTAETALVD